MQKFLISETGPLPFKTDITDQDARHIYKVLRLQAGDHITVTNGSGKDYHAQIISPSPTIINIKLIHELPVSTESPLDITLCTGMLKDKKMDGIIKTAVQLGIYKWIPFFSKRSVPTPNPKQIQKRLNRWEALSKESLKQCRRSRLVKISTPVDFENLLDQVGETDLKIAFWEKSERPIQDLKPAQSGAKVFILIGPEGGFSDQEIEMAHKKGFLAYSLGPRILRAETAAVSACCLIQHHFGDM